MKGVARSWLRRSYGNKPRPRRFWFRIEYKTSLKVYPLHQFIRAYHDSVGQLVVPTPVTLIPDSAGKADKDHYLQKKVEQEQRPVRRKYRAQRRAVAKDRA